MFGEHYKNISKIWQKNESQNNTYSFISKRYFDLHSSHQSYLNRSHLAFKSLSIILKPNIYAILALTFLTKLLERLLFLFIVKLSHSIQIQTLPYKATINWLTLSELLKNCCHINALNFIPLSKELIFACASASSNGSFMYFLFPLRRRTFVIIFCSFVFTGRKTATHPKPMTKMPADKIRRVCRQPIFSTKFLERGLIKSVPEGKTLTNAKEIIHETYIKPLNSVKKQIQSFNFINSFDTAMS